MKNIFLLLSAICSVVYGNAQNVGIGTTTPNASAMVDITSTTKGMLVPRMTQAQRNAISSPAIGLLIFQTDGLSGFFYNVGAPSAPNWTAIGGCYTSNGAWGLTGNLGTNPATNFIGTTDNQPLVFKVNNQKAGLISIGTTAIGYQALNAFTSGAGNTAMGYQALYSTSTGQYNSANGFQALYSNTGSNNTAMGYNALVSNTDASDNTAVGSNALFANTGSNNTATGSRALTSNSTGGVNTANGYDALLSNNTGSYNTAVGAEALRSNTGGNFNTAIGNDALYKVNGSVNTAVGYRALFNTTASDNNTAIGAFAGSAFNYGWNNTFIGTNANGNFPDQYNSIAIGQDAIVYGNSEAIIGNGSITCIGGAVNWSAFSDGRFKKNIQENVPGLQFITRLRPVTYRFDASGLDTYLHKNLPKENKMVQVANKQHDIALQEKEKIVYTGFVAQEVEKTAQQLGFDFSGVTTPKTENGLYSLRYAEFVVPLIKAVQEQQQMIAAQNKIMDELLKEIQSLKARINK